MHPRAWAPGALIVFWAALSTTAPGQTPGFFPTGSLSSPRMDHTATLLLDGTVLIAGGAISFSGGGRRVSETAELYDPITGTFHATGSMSTARFRHTATLLPDGTVLILGGLTSRGDYLASAELYDPASATFTVLENQPSISAFTANLLGDGRVLLTGCSLPCNHSGAAEIYDPKTESFTRIASPPYPPDFENGYVSTLLPDNTVLITGGCKAQTFDLLAGAFTSAGVMAGRCSVFCRDELQCSFYRYTATSLPNGAVLFGGSGEDAFNDFELYSPATRTFASLDRPQLDFNYYAAATLMPDGTVLITGGDGSEIYRPTTGTFELAEPTNGRRSLYTSTLLPDGTVLFAGGYNGGAETASAEIYRPAVLIRPPVLYSLSGDGRGQGAILHAGTAQTASPDHPASVGEALEIYFTGLMDGSVIPPQVSIGGRMAAVLWFGNAPGFVGLNQINVRVPSGIASGPAVPVRLRYLGRPTNEVTIAVQ